MVQFLRMLLGKFLRYGSAIGLVVVATIVTRHIQVYLGESISPLFFAAVMISTWFWGLGPGLTATLLAGWASAYYFPNNPPGAALFWWDDAIRLVVFLMVSLLIGWLTAVRKQAQRSNELLRQSEEHMRLLLEGMKEHAIVMLDPTGRVLSWNAGADTIEGYTSDEVVGQHASLFFPPDEASQGKPEKDLAVAEKEGRHEGEGWRVRKDGSRYLAFVVTTALRKKEGGIRGFVQVMRDITELRDLERQVLHISDAERRRMGHDLHDGLGQELTGLALLTQNLATKLDHQSHPLGAQANRIATMINHTIDKTRDLARGLSPVEIGPDGLRTALGNLVASVGQIDGRKCEFRCEGNISLHSDEAAMHLYRIAQEAINNALRHSKADRIELTLRQTPGGIVLSVRDNGVGLADWPVVRRGMGLRIMQYRARMIGAGVEVRPGDPCGTIVSCIYSNPGPSECRSVSEKTPVSARIPS
ncbi:MAG: PAS domain S-box protein [Tepidisphaerales bacterium]